MKAFDKYVKAANGDYNIAFALYIVDEFKQQKKNGKKASCMIETDAGHICKVSWKAEAVTA